MSAPIHSQADGEDRGSMAGIQLVYTEQDIEDILEANCEHMLGVRFLTRQFRTTVGVVDVLAKHAYVPNVYYVIEIKKGTLDPAAYAQAMRYAKWLNSERSKGGKRKFIPIIIGEHLQSTLNHLCNYFDHEYQCNVSNIHDVAYRLFRFDPLRGVAFSWHSVEQAGCEALRIECHCHIRQIDDELTDALWELEKAKRGD